MTYRFTARVVGTEIIPGDDVMLAGVAEDEEEGSFSLVFMGSVAEPSRQDLALGWDTHCVVTPDQNTAYGCVRKTALTNNMLTVSPAQDSLDALALEDAEIKTILDAPAEDVTRLRHILAKVMACGRQNARPERVGL
ncbi:Imm10 family immunity protein [Streptomyces sp. NPDC058239]|uniref:Imm10 family immunity protein n=1 Tax=unclassified Streptomyces TaxID=2593676 RepID=UPI0036539D1D